MDTKEPPKKKAKQEHPTAKTQTNLLNFFSSGSKPKPKTSVKTEGIKNENVGKSQGVPKAQSKPLLSKSGSDAVKEEAIPTVKKTSEVLSGGDASVPKDPIVPKETKTPNNVTWQSLYDNHVIVRKPLNDAPRNKVAAFDLDGTLVAWSSSFSGFWPNQLKHYELWSSTVPEKIRALYDDGYKIVLFSNQGGIQKAHGGKKATLVKTVMDWLASLIDRPVYAVMSTQSPKKSNESYHKPSPKMWMVATTTLNKRQEFDLTNSFFVGDSADPDDPQGGVDLKFAQAVGKINGNNNDSGDVLKFYTPTEYFGPSDGERRKKQSTFEKETPPPKEALETRSALLGGYLKGPILLILCGVQGSGKSTFCEKLSQKNNNWRYFSQDTISNGKPGKREKVEAAALSALNSGHSVIVDRMHLDPEQREHFVKIARSASVPAHVLLLNPPKDVISSRIKHRKNHPGKVEGEDGARRALASLEKLVAPTYAEGVQLISAASSMEWTQRMVDLYGGVGGDAVLADSPPKDYPLVGDSRIPSIALGTMGIGKKITCDSVRAALSAGFRAIDTAPTYKNEDRVGDVLSSSSSSSSSQSQKNVFCIAKIPKSVTSPEQVRPALTTTLSNLKRKSVGLLLLHWPCDVIAAGTLTTVWKEMEECVKDGMCGALGVCNFNINALSMLLCACSIRPVVNQIERHPLLSQMDIVDFCSRNDILVQAHTPLGHGKDELLSHPTITKISKEVSMSPAQTVLQWNLQQGVLVTPKCAKPDHARELMSCKMLSPEQMKALDAIDKGHRFVAPPFMFGSAAYCWGDKMPRK